MRSILSQFAFVFIALSTALAPAILNPTSASAESTASAQDRVVLDPAARLLVNDDASEYWTLYVELDGGTRISQRFGLSNAGPGEHTAVAVGHYMEPGKAPYRYANGRTRARWTLSEDRLFFDIAASHLDLHRPRGELRITKDDIEIILFFDFAADAPSAAVPSDHLPPHYAVEVLALGAATQGTVRPPWQSEARAVTGRMWMTHTWAFKDEAKLVTRRTEFYAAGDQGAFYGLDLRGNGAAANSWSLIRDPSGTIIESSINDSKAWSESTRAPAQRGSAAYPLSGDFRLAGPDSGVIRIGSELLRFDPLEVIPNPFRWFIRRMTRPQEVWAEAQFGGTLFDASTPPSPPLVVGASERAKGSENPSESETGSAAKRETVKGTAERSVAGVAFITFMNPVDRR